ncbi:helix-hairpin-helix domain-containing protein [Planotetraspora sp. A-T 1434]|uniref:ComEA family DNA-binding protein n=1 Tax=Planotetraspora sp. A-T 1434 TaxID=2979219 RepID=UPI0021BFBD61|nr:helix-hairpin-helix domain-containing protein [Planotetraspora sp. A-T 1434]MCT9931956.1 helix-hairpin-helix domain-containing protein [Planotetraspora sp. A-T 1434]
MVGSVLWALAPLLTCGFAAPFTVGYAAARLRSKVNAAAAVLYAGCLVVWVGFDLSDSKHVTFRDGLIMLAAIAPWLGATIHSLLIRTQVFSPRPFAPAPFAPTANEAAIRMAEQRRGLRREARDLAQRDPALAFELRIGRPDLPRHYDDGGLIDMNHAPAEVIATVPGMRPELVERIIQAREAVGVFASADEMSITANLPIDLSDELAEYTVYLP